VRVSEPAVPIRVDQRTRLAQSSETRRGVQFVYTLGGGAGAEISIYDVRGRLLQALPLEGVPGPHALAWDRQDRTGRRVARGIYFARLTSGTEHDVRKLVLLAD